MVGTLTDQVRQRIDRLAAWENVLCQQVIVGAEVVFQNPFHDRAQIGRRLQVTSIKEVCFLQARPIGNHPAAFDRAADE